MSSPTNQEKRPKAPPPKPGAMAANSNGEDANHGAKGEDTTNIGNTLQQLTDSMGQISLALQRHTEQIDAIANLCAQLAAAQQAPHHQNARPAQAPSTCCHCEQQRHWRSLRSSVLFGMSCSCW
jgi:hypothetical protein